MCLERINIVVTKDMHLQVSAQMCFWQWKQIVNSKKGGDL